MTPLESLTLDDVDQMVQVAVDAAAEAPSPEKKARLQSAAEIAATLRETVKAKREIVAKVEVTERVFWKEEPKVGKLELGVGEVEVGWRGRVAKAIEGGSLILHFTFSTLEKG